ncbi:preprotein translocase subunit SecG [Hymenobacter terrestris]|uniref:Protein-export membrane protein SecG n=1 Tax=Hymenobacter terrestris TaxID=2748310 RepID=A0ABX2Q5K9_9BACT|nr:preprotein translocase subunit SecG [Hymenobacter terrestris]NVO85261.1 preprotein translocase subunit SecG [Hymenobacter terrestris]
MYYAIIALILVICVLLSLVVLAQNPKGGGLSSQFGAGGGAAQMMGVKRTGDLLEKLTWGFAIGLMVLSLGSYVVAGHAPSGPVRSINQQRALETRIPATSAPVAPGAPAPAAPVAPVPAN